MSRYDCCASFACLALSQERDYVGCTDVPGFVKGIDGKETKITPPFWFGWIGEQNENLTEQ